MLYLRGRVVTGIGCYRVRVVHVEGGTGRGWYRERVVQGEGGINPIPLLSFKLA